MEGQSDGVDGSDGSSASGLDDGPYVGVERGAPFAPESVGDFAIDGAGSQSALRSVAGRLDGAICDEHEEMASEVQ